MFERGVTPVEVATALARCKRCRWQPEQGTWRAESCDADGEELVVAVAIEAGLLVVTVF